MLLFDQCHNRISNSENKKYKAKANIDACISYDAFRLGIRIFTWAHPLDQQEINDHRIENHQYKMPNNYQWLVSGLIFSNH